MSSRSPYRSSIKKAALFTIKQGSWVETALIPLFFIFVSCIHGRPIFGVVFSLFIGWIYRTFAFRYVRITGKSIVGFRFAKPFRKTYAYFYADIYNVYIPMMTRSGWHIEFIFKDGHRFSSQVNVNIESLCQHFMDKRVPVETASPYIREMITRYLARPQIDPRKQIAIRKAREAARKIKLRKLRGS
jgi:hypothetical protein